MLTSRSFCFIRKMSNFVQLLNPMTGMNEWKMVPEDYDYQQEVARAAFADMLHDTERNRLYYEGLKSAIALKRAQGEKVHVLDIGTGTGLLSMMAAKIGADSITAIEEFRPMANCAEKVIELNGFASDIKLVRKRSTGVTVGENGDMKQRANILVTEVFDTELIGEGAIGTFNHAHKELLTSDCFVVPSFGTMYAQIVSSDLISRWNSIKPIQMDNDVLLKRAPKCHVLHSLLLHDLQLSQFQEKDFESLADPVAIFNFDFSGQSGPIPVKDHSIVSSIAKKSGSCDGIFFWWDLKMDPKHEITLSCAPKWAHPLKNQEIPWRDHWMQAVYFPQSNVNVAKGDHFFLLSHHDEYSLWFDVSKDKDCQAIPMPNPGSSNEPTISYFRSRLGQINDDQRNDILIKAMKKVINQDSNMTVLCLSENSLLPLIAAKLGAGLVIYPDNNAHNRKYMDEMARINEIDGHKLMSIAKPSIALDRETDLKLDKIDLVIAEPCFPLTVLPWDNLIFWYMANRLFSNDQVQHKLMPCKAEIWAMPVFYKDLWKIRAPLGEVEGFKMKPFDDIIMGACSISDATVEPHPLWEYPCIALGKPVKLIELTPQNIKTEKLMQTEVEACIEDSSIKANGMALWMNWYLTESEMLCTGPISNVVIGEYVKWDMHSKQGVHLFMNHDCNMTKRIVKCQTKFNTNEAEMEFKFQCLY